MRGVVGLTAMMLASVLFSGCFVEKGAETQSGSDDSSSGTGSAAATTTTGASTGNLTGSVPAIDGFTPNATGLEVAFAFSASDADNDTLSWTLDFGDNVTANGTFQAAPPGNASASTNQTVAANQTAGALLANATHAYAAPGSYNVTLTVSDGKLAANRTLVLNVTGGAPPSEPMEPLAFSGSCTTEVSESVTHVFTVTPGQPLIHATITVGGGGVDLDWYLIDPSGGEADAAESFSVRSEGPLDAEAPAPGDWSIRVTCFLGAAASYNIKVAFA